MEEEKNNKGSDHDLIIRVDERTTRIEQAVARIEGGLATRVAAIEKDKADKKEISDIWDRINNDIEKRVNALETSKTAYFAMMAIYTAGVVVMIGLMLMHIFGSK